MKKLIAGLTALFVSLFGATAAFAAPFNAAANNPQVVAYYPTGDHGIPGEPFLHNGEDLVMRAGNSGNFQQWFYGYSAEAGGITEGDHSVWMNVGSKTSCPNGWFLVPDAYPEWGSYLEPGANYCTHTNDFHSSEQHSP